MATCVNCRHPQEKHRWFNSEFIECLALGRTTSENPAGCKCEKYEPDTQRPSVTQIDLNVAVEHVKDMLATKAKHLESLGTTVVVYNLGSVLSHINVIRNARKAGDVGTAEAALDKAEALLLTLLGIDH